MNGDAADNRSLSARMVGGSGQSEVVGHPLEMESRMPAVASIVTKVKKWKIEILNEQE